MIKPTKLDKLSSFAFFLGAIASKMQYLPITLFTPVVNITSLLLYLTGYSLWFVSSYLKPEQTPRYAKWYGFASTKEQSGYAAAIGILAMLTSMTALALPVMAIPAAWMIVTSNLFWVIGEYHKLKNPPPDENYRHSAQEQFISYALSIASMNLVAAITATFIFYNPAFLIPALVVSVIVSVGLSLTALGFWLEFNFKDHGKAPLSNTSYGKMTQGLGCSKDLSDTYDPAPYHDARLFNASEDIEEKGIKLLSMKTLGYSPY